MGKKILIALVGIGIALLGVRGCNKQLIDTTYSFDKAIISLPNGEIIEGEIDSWKDYDGDQLQVKIDEVTYVTHAQNVVLIAE